MQRIIHSMLILTLLVAAPACRAQVSVDKSRYIHHTLDMGGGIARRYHVFVPPELYNTRTRVPMVIMLHGGGGNGMHADGMTGWSALAAREGFIAVFPDGSGRREDGLLTWNAGHCCGYALRNKVDDVTFLSRMIDSMVREYPVDENRVYVTGLSNGGMMTHTIGRELPGKVAAIAPVIAGLFGDEAIPGQFVPMLSINGALDDSVPWAGGQGGGIGAKLGAWDGTALRAGTYQGTFWAQANACNPTPEASETETMSQWRYNCPAGREVVQYLMKDGGHSWPGGAKGHRSGDDPSKSMDATALIWDFFKAHRR